VSINILAIKIAIYINSLRVIR